MRNLLMMAALAAATLANSTLAPTTPAAARPSTQTVWSDAQDAPFWARTETREPRSYRGERATNRRWARSDRRSRSRSARRDRDDGDRPHSVTQIAGGYGVGPRPGRWCGWYMRTRHGGGPEYNLARNWRKRGTPLPGPQVGAIVVWNHHVGEIVGQAANGRWLVHSGNDSNRVRTRARSVAGASFRML
jgi:hypothetical protein